MLKISHTYIYSHLHSGLQKKLKKDNMFGKELKRQNIEQQIYIKDKGVDTLYFCSYVLLVLEMWTVY